VRASLPDPKFNFGFSMTLFHDNVDELPAMLRLVADSGGNFLKTDIGVIFNVSNLRHSVLQQPERYNEWHDRAQECARELGVKLFMRSPFLESGASEANRYGICDYLYTHAGITADGSYKPCYSVVLPARREVPGANLATLWNSAAMQRLRREHDTPRAKPSCQTCYMTLRGRDTLAKRTERFVRCGSGCAS
jgi:MoaA/NifB/PqqE/SkfB family radical SAM enzyme